MDELMERSPEAARLFVEKSKAAYQPHALPELKWSPQPIAPGRPLRFSKWLWVFAGYGLLAAAFWFWSEPRLPMALGFPGAGCFVHPGEGPQGRGTFPAGRPFRGGTRRRFGPGPGHGRPTDAGG